MCRRLIFAAIIALSNGAFAQHTDDERMFMQAWEDYRLAKESADPQRIVDSLHVVLDVAQQTLPVDDERLPIAWMNYGNALAATGALEQAQEYQEHGLELGRTIHGENSIALVPILVAYADSRSWHGRSDEQERYYRRALKIVEAEHGRDSLAYAEIAHRAGSRLLDLSGSTGGRQFLEDAHAIFVRELGADGFEAANTAHYLGRIEQQRRNFRKAIEYFYLALDGLADDQRKQNAVRARLVGLLEEQGDPGAALEQLLAIASGRTADDNENNPPIFRSAAEDPRSLRNRVTLETVDLEFTVDEDGYVRDPIVIASTGGRRFEEPALNALRNWRFIPDMVNGRAVAASNVRARVHFPPRDGVKLPYASASDDLTVIPIYRQQ